MKWFLNATLKNMMTDRKSTKSLSCCYKMNSWLSLNLFWHIVFFIVKTPTPYLSIEVEISEITKVVFHENRKHHDYIFYMICTSLYSLCFITEEISFKYIFFRIEAVFQLWQWNPRHRPDTESDCSKNWGNSHVK